MVNSKVKKLKRAKELIKPAGFRVRKISFIKILKRNIKASWLLISGAQRERILPYYRFPIYRRLKPVYSLARQIRSYVPKLSYKMVVIVVLAGLVFFQTTLLTAFEAHVINVTATIVNDIPEIDPPGGEFCDDGSLIVTLSVTLSGASIYYTTDGSDPDCFTPSGILYTSPFPLITSATIKARSCHDSKQSAIMSEYYDVSVEYCQNVCDPNQELVINGGFETPIVGTPQKWDIFTTAEVPGWNIAWVRVEDPYQGYPQPTEAYLELHRGVLGLAAEGDQYAELDTDWDGPSGLLNQEPASVRISQDIATISGYNYLVKYSFSPRPGQNADNNYLEFSLDNVQKNTHQAVGGSDNNWTEYEHSFVAGGGLTNLSFADLGIGDSFGTFLDKVSVRCVPPEEPACAMELTKTTEQDEVELGEEIIYHLTLDNYGTAVCTGSGVQLLDTYGENFEYVEYTSNRTPSSVTQTAEDIKWGFGNVYPDDPLIEIDLTLRVKDSGCQSPECGSTITNTAKFWSDQTDWGTPVTADSTIFCQSSSSSPSIVLNEFLPNPEGEEYGFDFGTDADVKPQGEWVELYNLSDQTVDLAGYYLTDADPAHRIDVESCRTNTGGTTIGPNDFLVVYRKGSDTCISHNFSLNNSGDTVNLYDNNDNLIDYYSYLGGDYCDLEPTPDEENINSPSGICTSVPPNKSYARIPDGADNWVDPIPTPGGFNIVEVESLILGFSSSSAPVPEPQPEIETPEEEPSEPGDEPEEEPEPQPEADEPLAQEEEPLPAGEEGEAEDNPADDPAVDEPADDEPLAQEDDPVDDLAVDEPLAQKPLPVGEEGAPESEPAPESSSASDEATEDTPAPEPAPAIEAAPAPEPAPVVESAPAPEPPAPAPAPEPAPAADPASAPAE